MFVDYLSVTSESNLDLFRGRNTVENRVDNRLRLQSAGFGQIKATDLQWLRYSWF